MRSSLSFVIIEGKKIVTRSCSLNGDGPPESHIVAKTLQCRRYAGLEGSWMRKEEMQIVNEKPWSHVMTIWI